MAPFRSVVTSVKRNLTEIYLGALLFVGIPAVFWIYFDLQAAFAATVAIQTIVMSLYIWRVK